MASSHNNGDDKAVNMSKVPSSDSSKGQAPSRAHPKPLARRYIPYSGDPPDTGVQQQSPLILQTLRPFQRRQLPQPMSIVETNTPSTVGGQIPSMILQPRVPRHCDQHLNMQSTFIRPNLLPGEEEKDMEACQQQSLLAPRSTEPHAIATTAPFSRQRHPIKQTTTTTQQTHGDSKKFPQKHLPVPKHTFKNPDSQKARRKREMMMMKRGGDKKDKKISCEELTEMIRRSAREHASAAKAMRMQRKLGKLGGSWSSSSFSNNHNDGDGGGCAQQQQPCAMPMFFRAERPSPKIVVTSPEGAVRFIRGSGYWG